MPGASAPTLGSCQGWLLTRSSVEQTGGAAHLPLGIVVVTGSLLDGAVLRLRHGFHQRHTLPRGLRQIAGPQPMRRDAIGVEPCQRRALLDDQVDRLRRQRLAAEVAPLVDGPEQGAALDLGRCQPILQRRDRLADDPGDGALARIGGLGPAEAERRGRQRGGIGGRRGRLPRTGCPRSGAPPLRIGAVRRSRRRAAGSRGRGDRSSGSSSRCGAGSATRSPVRACSLLRAGGRAAAADREPESGPDLPVGEGAVETAPAVHRPPERQPALDRCRRMRAPVAASAPCRRKSSATFSGMPCSGSPPCGSDPRGDGRRT